MPDSTPTLTVGPVHRTDRQDGLEYVMEFLNADRTPAFSAMIMKPREEEAYVSVHSKLSESQRVDALNMFHSWSAENPYP